MRVLLDTCVLVPSPIRQILLSLAESELFFPLWSDKIFNEWEYFVFKNSNECVDSTRIEIILMKSKWKESLVPRDKVLEETLFLPDENDRHVFASAITGNAEILLTNNLKDFPSGVLARYCLTPRNVDNFLLELFYEFPDVLESSIRTSFDSSQVKNKLNAQSKKAFMKKHGLPRLAKAMS